MAARNALRTGLAIATAALVLYLATGQRLFHGFDAYHYLRFVATDQLRYWLHALYLPTAWAWSQALAWFGIELYEALRALSAVAAAVGVFACHRAALRLGLPAERAAMAAVAAATLPAVLHAATVVEIDAITFCGLALAWVPFAALVRDLRWRRAVAVGCCTGITAGFHAAAHLGVTGLCALLIAWRRTGAPHQRAGRAAAIVATHLLVAALASAASRSGGQATMATNTLGLALPLARLPATLGIELLLPYAPVCLLPLAAAWRRELRGALAVLLVCVAVHVLVATMVMAHAATTCRYGPQGSVERGSFLLALAPCFVLLGAAAAPRGLAWLAIALGAVSAIVQQRAGDWPPDPAGHAAGWRQVTAGRPSHSLFADAREWAWVARRHPEVEATVVPALRVQVEAIVASTGAPLTADTYLIWFGVESAAHRAAGRELFVSDLAMAALRASPDAELANAVARLGEVYALRRHEAHGFVAWTVHPR
jgi:hypothetical protein